METQFQIPRFLGLSHVSPQKRRGMFDVELGYSPALKRSLLLDQKGLDLLMQFLKPNSITKTAKKLGLSQREVRQSVQSLCKAKILKPVKKVPKTLQRYDRHLLFFGVSGAEPLQVQKKISKSKVALIGMGGIGNWVGLGLVGAGLKELRLIDFDTVELTNLTRQVLFDEQDVGLHKTTCAKRVLEKKNSHTKITEVHQRVLGEKALENVIKDMDFVVLSADRPAKIHDWVDAVCIKYQVPYLNIGYRDGVGVVGPMTVQGTTSCYQCHKPRHTSQKTTADAAHDLFESRYQAPSFGPLNALASSIGVSEILKYVGGFGECKSLGNEVNVDPLTLEVSYQNYSRDPNCWNCS